MIRWLPSALASLATSCALLHALAASTVAPAVPPVTAASAALDEDRWSRLRDVPFQNWNENTGLPHPVATALAQDGAGFLWVGTQDGLARFDGYRFKAYKADPQVPGALSSSYIDALHADRAGRLWVGMDNGQLARFDRRADRFTPVDTGTQPGTAAEITAFDDDGRTGLWVGSSSGLLHVEATAADGAPVPPARPVTAIPAGGGIKALLRDATGVLWVGTHQGLQRCEDPLGTPRCAPYPLVAPGSPSAPPVSALAQAADGRLWIGTLGAGVFTIAPQGVVAEPVREPGAMPSGVSAGTARAGAAALALDDVSTLTITPGGTVWVGTNGGGLQLIDPATRALRHVRHDQRLASSISSDAVFAAVVDRSGLLWFGGRRGLSRTDPDQRAITTVLGQTSRADGLTDIDAPAMMRAADGQLWVGLADNGIDVLDPVGVRTHHLDIAAVPGATPGAPGVAARNPVASMAQGPDQAVWIGTRDGLFRSDARGQDLRRIAWSTKRRPAIQEMVVAGHTLWIGARTEGLWSLDVSPGANAVPTRPPGSDSLVDERVIAVRVDPQGRVWVGTPTGLAIYDPVNRRVERFTSSAADPASLSNDFVSCILFDRQGRAWLGTLGGGVNLVTGRDAAGRLRFRRLGATDGMPRPNIGQLLEGADGRIWASTDGGFAVIDPTTFRIRGVSRADGGVITSYWINSGVDMGHGELVFGGAGGITVIRPTLLKDWTFKPPVVVTEARVQGRPDDARATATGGLALHPGETGFSVEFAALDLSAPERNRYAYRLAGVDDAWVDTDASRRLAAYTNLAPGDYELQLRGSNRDGAWSDHELRLPVHVQPRWFQAWWARALEVLAALLAIGGLVWVRTRALVLRKRQLQQEVAARTAELELKQQELLRANETLAMLANFDPLTRCLNRRAFLEQAEPAVRDTLAQGQKAFCVMVDIDHFKFFNDQFGHPVGDAVIRGVAAVLQRSLRSGDLICRYGGEEFCVLLANVDEAIALMLAERIRARIQHEAGPGVRDVPGLCVTASVGVAGLDAGDGVALEKLIARADQALYAAKHAGRNCVSAGPDAPIASKGPLPPQWVTGATEDARTHR